MTDRRRRLPAVNTLLAEASDLAPRAVLLGAVREALAAARERGGEPPADGWKAEIERRVAARARRSLVRVVNATGVVLHTNLGRAPLAAAAIEALTDAAGYSALEMDLADGERSSRQRHVRGLLTELTGAEDAVVVNNAAAALLLTLNTLARGGETIVSRGELVEIGGGFRIPEILAKSGTTLIEVGTTNRTHRRDYALAIGAPTRCLLKVHRSNFVQSGFVSDAPVEELVALGAPRALPVVHDVGSGLLIDLAEYGLTGEPLVRDSVAAGAIAVFSGDKLLGGPQAGIVLGPATRIAALASNPLARALRADKAALGALEATLALYRDPAEARLAIPVLAMLTAAPGDLKRRARRLARRIPGAGLEDGTSSVGGGAFPGHALATTLVAVPADAPERLLETLRRHDPPVIARAAGGRVLFDVRTLRDDETAIVAAAVAAARA